MPKELVSGFFVTNFKNFLSYFRSNVQRVLSEMEEKGRTNVREEACAIFESQVLEDIAQGHAPSGPGLDRDNEADPAFYTNALIVEGHRKSHA